MRRSVNIELFIGLETWPTDCCGQRGFICRDGKGEVHSLLHFYLGAFDIVRDKY